MRRPCPAASLYTETFYDGQDKNRRSAQVVVPIVCELVRPRSVIDLGCGVGTWLSVFREHGVETIEGVDGAWVPRDKLAIPAEAFSSVDLAQPFARDRQFDLVMSLEVAEHLPPGAARTLVRSLTGLGPVVLFSAAIPFQGGDGHVNEQWPEYWAAHFAAEDYVAVDCIRKRIWGDAGVVAHYAQNILLFVRRGHLERDRRLKREAEDPWSPRLSMVHPEFYLRYADPRTVTIDPTKISEYRSLSFTVVLGLLPALAKRALASRTRRLLTRVIARPRR